MNDPFVPPLTRPVPVTGLFFLGGYRAEISCGSYDIESITPTPELYAQIYGEPCVDEDDEGSAPVPGDTPN